MKIKQILQKWLINNLGYKILALVVAFVIWLVIVNIQDPEATRTIYNIPVTKLNENLISENDYEYTVASGETANIVITGKRSIVYSLNKNDFVATANFEELSFTNAIPINVELSAEKSSYASQIKITQQTRSMILTLDEIISKTMDVEINYAGEKAEDLVIDNTVVEPAKITVTAPKSLLDNYFRVEATINMSDADDGVTLRATPVFYNYSGGMIEQADDVEYSADEVTVTFAASYIKYVPIQISSLGSPAEGYEITDITTSFRDAVLKGSRDALASIDQIRLPNTLLPVHGATRNVTVAVNLEEYIPVGVSIYDSNKTVFVTAVIERTATETTEEPSEEESTSTEETTGDETESQAETESEAEADTIAETEASEDSTQ